MINIIKTRWNSMEAIVLENSIIKVVILPELGGKTASIVYKNTDFELMAQKRRAEYRIPNKETPFEECDASGFDDAFPTIAASKIQWGNKEYVYTDHGEIWRSKFAAEIRKDRAVLTHQSKEYPYSYIKTISLKGNQVVYDYHISNMSEYDFPCIWTMHGLVRYEEDMELFYPKEIKQFLNVVESRELQQSGLLYQANNENYDFCHVPTQKAMTQIKYYAYGRVREGRCGYCYPSQDISCEIQYDTEVFPYLGMWITAGGFRGDYNCAWEPSNGFYDSVETADNNKALFVLKKGQRMEFSIAIALNKMKK